MTRVVDALPRAIRTDDVWIPMPDGARLAARIWRPVDAEQDPVPAILEYIPYRKGDWTAPRDAVRHPYTAGHGYACVRVDLRGSGDSDGVLEDEYTAGEHDDGLAVLTWIAAQPWCTGRCGIMGKSWGGFNALQIAARRPPELGAVISVASTDDRYADDVHYMGGCVLGTDMLGWASTMLAFAPRPPDPASVGERWRAMWLERLEGLRPLVETWLAHQRRDAYWAHGSVCEDYAAITCPVYMVGGWMDPYRNAILRFLAGAAGPRRGLIGPWAHTYPDEGAPGPAIGFLQESLRWWDRWLKDVDTGIDREPMLHAWMAEPVDPAPAHAERPGRWVAEPAWPAAGVRETTWPLDADGRLADPGAPARPGAVVIRGLQTCGLESGTWVAWGAPGDGPPDQRREDGASACFDSGPLAERVEILGFPEVDLRVRADRPLALVAVRLCAVAPGGASLLVARGLLNLCHRTSHATPERLVPGRDYDVTVRLTATGQAVPAGHRLRLAVSPTYWPWAWPSPEPVTLTVTAEASRLRLPVRPPRPEDADHPGFGTPEHSRPLAVQRLGGRVSDRTVTREAASGRATVVYHADWGGHRVLPDGLECLDDNTDTFTIVEGDPLSARVETAWTIGVARGDVRTRMETRSAMTADADDFLLTNAIDAYEGEHRIFSRAWTARIPRDHV